MHNAVTNNIDGHQVVTRYVALIISAKVDTRTVLYITVLAAYISAIQGNASAILIALDSCVLVPPDSYRA